MKHVKRLSTNFPQKANLNELEVIINRFWDENPINNNPSEQEIFVLSGPTYVNAEPHFGTMYNLMWKDFKIKSFLIRGYRVKFKHGFDSHGLPISNIVIKNQFDNKVPTKFDENLQLYKECEKFVDFHKKTLSYFITKFGIRMFDGDTSNNSITQFYGTDDNTNQIVELNFVLKCLKNGLLKIEKQPVQYCLNCKTNISLSEILLRERLTLDGYVLFKVINHNIYLLVWTTRIFSLVYNQAIGICNIKYTLSFSNSLNKYIVTSEFFFNSFNVKYSLVFIRYIEYYEMVNFKYEHQFNNKICSLVDFDQIQEDAGTGIVHMSRDTSLVDNRVLEKYGYDFEYIKITSDVENDRTKIQIQIEEVNKTFSLEELEKFTLDYLKQKDLLFDVISLQRHWETCWRCKTELIFLCDYQFFLDISRIQGKIETILTKKEEFKITNFNRINSEKIEKRFLMFGNDNTDFGFLHSIKTRENWCISRQRIWGTFLPVLFCKLCNKPFLFENVLEYYIQQLQNNCHPLIWFNETVDNIKQLLKDKKCDVCKTTDYYKKIITLDVWLDSGVVPLLFQSEKLPYITMIVEGIDQISSWFQVTTLVHFLNDINAGENFVQHMLLSGYIVANNNVKMSKSMNNYLSTHQLLERYSPDILRLFSLTKEMDKNLMFDISKIDGMNFFYIRLRNNIRYFLQIVETLKKEFNLKWTGEIKTYDIVDKFFLSRTVVLFDRFYDFNQTKKVFEKDLMNEDSFISTILNDVISHLNLTYIELIKNYLYEIEQPLSKTRAESIFNTVSLMLFFIVKTISPVISFTAEEIHQYMCKNIFEVDANSVFTSNIYNTQQLMQLIDTFSEYDNVALSILLGGRITFHNYNRYSLLCNLKNTIEFKNNNQGIILPDVDFIHNLFYKENFDLNEINRKIDEQFENYIKFSSLEYRDQKIVFESIKKLLSKKLKLNCNNDKKV